MQQIPKIKVSHKRVQRMSPDEYRQCIRMGFDDGIIRLDLRKCYNRPGSKSQVVLAKDPDGRIRSWALIDRSWSRPTVCYWTQQRWRRKGLGARVAKRVAKLLGDVYDHYPQNNVGFFNAIGAKLHAPQQADSAHRGLVPSDNVRASNSGRSYHPAPEPIAILR